MLGSRVEVRHIVMDSLTIMPGAEFKAMSDTKSRGRVVATNEDKYLI